MRGLNSRPSVYKTVFSGSTAWHGAFRFRQYLKSVKARFNDSEQPDNDLRELEFKKNQYGPRGECIVLRYQRGLFLPEAGVSDLDKATRTAKAEDVVMDLLRRAFRPRQKVVAGQGRGELDERCGATAQPAPCVPSREIRVLDAQRRRVPFVPLRESGRVASAPREYVPSFPHITYWDVEGFDTVGQ